MLTSRRTHPTRTAGEPARPRGRFGAGALDDPRLVGAAAFAVALALVALRVAVAGHGDVGRLVLLGSRFVAPGSHPGVPVTAGNGYDGQFYYRLGLEPFNFSAQVHGIHMDSAARFERIAYPTLAWALAAGRAWLVPWSLIAVNAIGIGLLGWMGGLLARDGARHAAWGLLVSGYFGFVWSLSRDLTEVVEATFLLAALLAVRRGRPLVAGLALGVAALSREPALIVAVALAAVGVTRWWRRGRAPAAPGMPAVAPVHPAAWLVPVAMFATWQAVAASALGHLPLLASGQHNLDLPFVGLARGVAHYAPLLPSRASLLWFGELAVLGAVVLSAGRSFRTSTAAPHERLAWIAYGVLTICLAPGIWLGDVGFRSLDDLYLLSCVVLLASPRRARLVAPAMGLTWLVVAAELVKVI